RRGYRGGDCSQSRACRGISSPSICRAIGCRSWRTPSTGCTLNGCTFAFTTSRSRRADRSGARTLVARSHRSGSRGPLVHGGIASQRLADTYEETEYGFAKRTSFRRPDGSERSAILPFVFPTGGQTGLPRAPCLQLRTPIDDENTRQYFYTLYDLEIEMKARLRSQLGDEILDGNRV